MSETLTVSLGKQIAADKKRAIVFLTWVVIAVTSVPFERTQDDEVIYFLEARHMLAIGPVAHLDLVFVPQILGAIASEVYNSLLAARAVSALAVLATAIVIYNIKKDDATFISAMLYLTSFYTIRFGLRFYLDPYGGLFTILAIYFLYKEKSHLVGISSALAVFSRELAAPLFPIYAVLVYRRKMSLGKFLLGFAATAVLGVFWIYLATRGIQSAIVVNLSEVTSTSSFGFNSLYAVAKVWIQYALIGPLVVVGILCAKGGKGRPEFYPMVFSFLILCLVPGFIQYGAGTEYPYIFNTTACLVAGVGLKIAYEKLKPKSTAIVKVAVVVLVVQFAAQSYLSTALTVNHTIGIQDYGYWYDQELISYMNNHYNGGTIYSSTLVLRLNQALEPSVVWNEQPITLSIVNDPPWLVTYSSYIIVKSIPTNTTIVTIGPYTVIHRGDIPLSSFIELNNATQFFG